MNTNNDNEEVIEDYKFVELDNREKMKHNFKWIELKDLKDVDFRPTILKDKLSESDFKFEHIIYREK